ncbi:MAG: ParB/RepB/Spo0J family partition protein [Gammaproteobacteria bacterium]|jgi:ParB family chromosome partitioning protein|nr:ParB/RepB/Spo0J family partition protein [Gammaproteobacteria bacterium]
MTARKKAKPRLGRGLDALLGAKLDSNAERENLRHLDPGLLQRGRYQPRTRMDEAALKDLANSIRSQGVLQPIVVRELPSGNFEIIAGERRWRAAGMAGLETVPVVVRQLPDEAAMAVALIENIQREDLSPVEEAAALQRLIEEFGLTHQQAADSVGRSRTAVTNLLRLLTLSTEVRGLLEAGKLEMGHARALLALKGEAQRRLAREVVAKGLSVRETEQLVRRQDGDVRKKKKPPRATRDPNLARLEEDLSDRLGTRVRVQHAARGGKLVIDYHSLDELEGILERIR